MKKIDESIKYGRLLGKYLKDDLTDIERKDLEAWLQADDKNKHLLIQLLDSNEFSRELKIFNEADVAEAWVRMNKSTSASARIRVIQYGRRFWWAAASVVLVMSVASWFYLVKNAKKEKAIVEQPATAYPKEIMPGGEKALLTLDNGSVIVLDSAENGDLAVQGNSKVIKLNNGELIYQKENKTGPDILFNTVSTPRGGQYKLTLPDGSRVWLNAASSIRFPSSFTGNERRVQVTGECYFEVAHNSAMPFRLTFNSSTGNTNEIEVLGTDFNINTYTDEPESKATLLEGRIKIKGAGEEKILSPGQQAQLGIKEIRIKENVDLSQTIAWKEGFFWFDNMDIKTLMRQVARWYDVDVVFKGKITDEGFSGKISKGLPLSKLFQILRLNDVQIETESKKIIVSVK